MNKLLSALAAVAGLAVFILYIFEPVANFSTETWTVASWVMVVFALLFLFRAYRKGGRTLWGLAIVLAALILKSTLMNQFGSADAFDAPTWDFACVIFGTIIGFGGLAAYRQASNSS